MQRAKAGPLEGRSAFELMNDPDEMFVLIIWCLKSRTDPSFTWEQAMDTPFGAFSDPPPAAPEVSTDGASLNGSGSKAKPARPAPARSSGATST
jgi:hypothetical protein